ncbi:HAD family hydrolase [Leptolyngbya sp. AN02str]|uniref:HAD family hydrolase n=1 Tax=Leptolyngbya sp. AN02str TaxID=3423363 RepID=UPI003D315E76
MLKALLFDLDGTLANTDPLHYFTWQEVMSEFGITIDESFYQSRFSGRLNEAILQDLLPHLTPKENQNLAEYKEAKFRERTLELRPLPGLGELLAWSHAHALQQAVVTNAPSANTRHLLKVLGLEEAFPVVVLAEELPQGKPDPLPYQTALNHLGIQAHEAIAFEDSPSGIRSAVDAEICTVAIASTHSPDHLLNLGASLVIADFTDLRLEALLRSALQSGEAVVQ